MLNFYIVGKNIVEKIFEAHRVYGEIEPGKPVGLRIDQVYTQDATGTMAWLQFETIGVDEVKVPLAVSYVDHNMIQSNFMNPDDHLFLQTIATRYGAYFSKPGNGISHQVHLERFASPGKVALGTDSHTPTGGGMGMIAIGVGGLDAATVMAGAPFELTMPKVMLIKLIGKLNRPWVTAMDVVLEILRRLTVKGGVGKILEYSGPGIKDLSVTERATITNMGTELGATTSIFPSDERTRYYLKAQKRGDSWIELHADKDAEYSDILEIDLNSIEPLIAKPHSPDNVVPVRELSGTKVDQVCIGSCTNSSYKLMQSVASILKENSVTEGVSLLINPGSKQVYEMLSRKGLVADMIAAGARILESSCGPCIGMGGSPGTGQISIRSYNRNFKGRSGNKDAFVYLASPVSCVVFAIKGKIVDPRNAGITLKEHKEPSSYLINDNLFISPKKGAKKIEILKGPNIKDVPVKEPLPEKIEAEVLIKLLDNITTDDIMPARFMKEITFANMGKYVYFDERFAKNGTLVEEHPFNNKKYRGANILLAGANYGCGSSREHAPQALYKYGIRAIIAESFAEIFAGNCASLGIVGVTVASKDLASTSEAVKLNPSIEIEVDLAEKTVKCGTSAIKIEIPEGRRQAFLNGTWDAMAILQQNQGNVADVEKRLAYLHYE